MPARLKKILPLLAVAAIILTWPRIKSFLTVSTGFEITESASAGSRQFTILKVDFLQIDENGGGMRMTASRVDKGADNHLRLRDIVGRRSTPGGETTIRAASGDYDEANGVLTLREGVEMVTPDGFTATTEAVSYHRKTDRIESLAPVEIAGDRGRITGDRLEYYPADGVMKVIGSVRCTIATGVI